MRAVDADVAEAIVAFRWRELLDDEAIGCLVSCSKASIPEGESGRLTRRREAAVAEGLMLLELRAPKSLDGSDPDPLFVEKISSSWSSGESSDAGLVRMESGLGEAGGGEKRMR